jgi:hypothetical protein
MYQYINLYVGTFTDKATNKDIQFKTLNVLDLTGKAVSLKVHKDFDSSSITELKPMQRVSVEFIPDSNNIARVINITKATA